MTGDGKETRRLGRAMTAREASLKLRYAMDEAEHKKCAGGWRRSAPGRFAEVADLIIDCTNGPELLAHAAETS